MHVMHHYRIVPILMPIMVFQVTGHFGGLDMCVQCLRSMATIKLVYFHATSLAGMSILIDLLSSGLLWVPVEHTQCKIAVPFTTTGHPYLLRTVEDCPILASGKLC